MVKRIIAGLVLLVFVIALVAGSAPATFAIPTTDYAVIDGIRYSPGEEIIELRTRTSKTTWLGGDRYALDASIGSMHYKDNPDDPDELWKDIETDIKTSPKPDWYCQVVKGNWHLLIDHDTTVALGKDGHWIGFRYEGIAYLDWATKEYVILQQRQDVTPIVKGNKITWHNIFYGTDLEYIYTPDGFKENLIVSQATRDWLAQNPPSSYGLNNATTYIGGYLECDWKNAYPAEDYLGNPINWNNANEFADFGVFWRHPVKDKIITALPLGWARHNEVEEVDWVKLRHRFYKKDGKHWLLFGAKVTGLNQYPEGEIVIDPTIDEQVGAATDDAGHHTGAGWATTHTYYRLGHSGSYSTKGGQRFTGIIIAQGSTIDVAYMTLKARYDRSDPNCNQTYEGDDTDDSATFSTEVDFDGRARTTATVDWNNIPSWTAETDYDTPSLVTIVQEIINRPGWSSGNALSILDKDNSSASGDDRIHWSYDGDSSKASKIHIEYSAGGPSAPTVVTNAATSVEETTATLSGNITATGGENCTDRGFQWDIDSGVPYASNWTEQGNYGICNFTHGLTSLIKGELYYYRAGANNSAGWGWGSEVTFLTKPDPATSFASTDNGTTWISLGWTNGTGMDYVEARYAEGSPPSDNTSGTLGYWGSGTSANVTSLSAATTYHFRIFTHATEGGLWSTSDNNPACQDTTDTEVSAPTVVTNAASSIEETTATASGNITATGGENADYRGFEWDVDSGAPYTSNWTEGGSFGVGNFSHGLTALTEGELYYLRAMAHNSAGWGYGSEVTFLTKPDEPDSLTATGHNQQVNLSWNMGTGSDNITIRGQIDSYPADKDSGTLIYNGTGTSCNHTGLTNGDHWYYRGWSWCGEGGKEQWSDNYDQTDAIPHTIPTVTTTANATGITDTTAMVSGNITVTGGVNATNRGFEWGSTCGNYTDNWTEAGSFGVGAFSHTITSLSANTTYFFRAMAYNSEGWGYGNCENFTTGPPEAEPLTAPTGFALTAVSNNEINATWNVATGNVSGYLLLVSTISHPNDPNSTYAVAYSGNATSVNLVGYNLELAVYYFSLWAYGNPEYSATYATGEIGEDTMTEIADVLSEASQMLIPLLALAVFSFLAFWRSNAVLFMLTAGAALMVGLQWYDIYTTSAGLTIGLMLIGYGLVCVAFAFRCLFWRSEE